MVAETGKFRLVAQPDSLVCSPNLLAAGYPSWWCRLKPLTAPKVSAAASTHYTTEVVKVPDTGKEITVMVLMVNPDALEESLDGSDEVDEDGFEMTRPPCPRRRSPPRSTLLLLLLPAEASRTQRRTIW